MPEDCIVGITEGGDIKEEALNKLETLEKIDEEACKEDGVLLPN